MIMARNDDGTYSRVVAIKTRDDEDVTTAFDVYGNVVFGALPSIEELGVPPLVFMANGMPLLDYSIKADSVQNGAPSTDSPVEALGTGDKTANLFSPEMIDIDATTRYYLTADGVEHENSTWYTTPYIPVSENTVYLTGVQAISPSICWYDENKNYIGGQAYNGANEHTVHLNGAKYVRFTLNAEQVNTAVLNYGYKIPVVTRGKNLFDKSTATVYEAFININYYWFYSTDGSKSIRIPVEPDTTYTLSIGVAPAIFRICESDLEDPTPTTGTGIKVSRIIYSGNISEYTFTTSSTAKFLIFQGSGTVFDEWFGTLQLELGTEATNYEPYVEPIETHIFLDSPLYKIGDYADTLCYAEQKVERYIKELILTGEEEWFEYSLADTYRISLSGNTGITAHGLSTHFKCVATTSELVHGSFVSGTNSSYFKYENSSLSDFKSYLTEQYAAGTPVKVWYVLATPETESVELPEVPTFNGTTVLDVNTEVKPSEVYVKYSTGKQAAAYDEQLTEEYLNLMEEV